MTVFGRLLNLWRTFLVHRQFLRIVKRRGFGWVRTTKRFYEQGYLERLARMWGYYVDEVRDSRYNGVCFVAVKPKYPGLTYPNPRQVCYFPWYLRVRLYWSVLKLRGRSGTIWLSLDPVEVLYVFSLLLDENYMVLFINFWRPSHLCEIMVIPLWDFKTYD